MGYWRHLHMTILLGPLSGQKGAEAHRQALGFSDPEHPYASSPEDCFGTRCR